MKMIISDKMTSGGGVTYDRRNDLIKVTDNGSIRKCVGCFSCWTKTPCKCVINDGYGRIGAFLGRCDELEIISECVYGGFSPFVKNVLDRAISYVHPDFEMRKGIMRHKARFGNSLKLRVRFYGESITADGMELALKVCHALSENFGGKLVAVTFEDSHGGKCAM